MQFEWDEQKNQQNILKHGIAFSQAKKIFQDPFQLCLLDKRYSYFEERWITLGATRESRILVVANLFFSDQGEEIIRIISARPANTKEVKAYENS
ncbi:BrnT family toxin [Hydrogenovibrio halophilus]|uniref:BrnT family toxin n=1 Tax=Hydrogenovibrio halophilus TaxID=373391 RepID=UPI00037A1F58|nr:BrnT family toxin [Hydrogenovibrio halophilus]